MDARTQNVDDLPVVTVVALSEMIAETEISDFAITRTGGDLSRPLTLRYKFRDGTRDPEKTIHFERTLGPGQTTFLSRFTAHYIDDAYATRVLELKPDASYRLGNPSQAMMTVRDKDRPEVSIADAGSVTEGETLAFPVRLSYPLATQVTVAYTLTGTATAGVDYTDSGSGTVTFEPQATEQMIRLVTRDDSIIESGEGVEVRLLLPDPPDPASPATLNRTVATGWVRDDDGPSQVTVAAVAATVTEGEAVEFTLTRADGDVSEALEVFVQVTDGGAVLTDTPPRSVSFEAGEFTATLRLHTRDDDDPGGTEDVVLKLRDVGGYDLGTPSQATVTVRDDEIPVVTVAAVSDAVTEGMDVEFTLTLTGDVPGTLTVKYEVTETGSVLRVPPRESGVFGAGEHLIRMRTVDDTDDEPDAAVTLTLQPDAAYDLGNPSEAAVAVQDDDSLSVVTVAAVVDTVTEEEAVAFIFTREGGDRSEALRVIFTLTDGTSEWTELVLFLPGELTHTLRPFAGRPDMQGNTGDESVTTLTVTLGDGGGVYDLGTPREATVLVLRDDTPPTASVAPSAAVTEGGDLVFPVELSDASSQAVTVPYDLGGTATEDEDYTDGGSGTVTFAPGETEKSITLGTLDDTVDEENETVEVTLQDGDAHDLGTSVATGTITDNDGAPTVSVADVTAAEDASLVFAVILSHASSRRITVDYAVTPGTAAENDDYGGTLSGTVTFAPGEMSKSLTLDLVDDTAAEPDETLTLTLSGLTGPASLPDDTASGTITDDDRPVVTVAEVAATVTEGEAATFTLTRASTDIAGPLVVHFTLVDPGTVLDQDAPVSATIPADQTMVTVTVQTDDDLVDEPAAAFTLRLDDGETYDLGTPSAATVTVRDDDATPAVTLVLTPLSIAESGEASTVTATLDRPSSAATTVTVSVAPESPAVAGDYTLSTNLVLTIPAGATDSAGVVTITAVDNDMDAPDRTVTVSATAENTQGVTDPQSVTLAITDDDNVAPTGAPTIDDTTPVVGETLTADASGIGDADGLTGATFTWRWLRVASGGTETQVGTGATYVVAAGDVGSTLKVESSFTDDGGTEETVESAVTAAVEAAPLPTVSVERVASPVEEGADAQFRVKRTVVTAGALTVRYGVSETGAMVASDEEGAQSVAFADGDTERTVTVPTEEDTGHEADSTVTVTLTADAAYDLGTASAEVTVEDDDNAAPTGAVTIDDTTPLVGETLTADASSLDDSDGLTSRSFTWQWVRVSGGTETEIPGATTASYTVAAADVGSTLKVRVGFTDDDNTIETVGSAETVAVAPPLPAVTVASDGDVTEGSPAVFTLTRTGDLAQTLEVAYTVTATGDFGAATGAGTATFLVNSSTVQVPVATTGDSAHEVHGSVTLTLQANPVAYDLGDEDAATVAVRDDDDDSPTTGTVTITGTPTEGETLTADTSGLTDGDGLDNATYVYQWVRTPAGESDADISGATSQTYVPVFADAGATLKVRVTVTDDEGHDAVFESAPTSAVAALPRPEVTVVSDGDVTEGDLAVFTLTRTGDLAQTLDVAYGVAAIGDFGVTTGASTATFPASSPTVQVTVATTGDSTHEAYGSVTLTLVADAGADPAYLLGDPATATAAVRDDDNAAPTGAVTIDDTTPVVGETLTADASGVDDPDGLTSRSITWQWLRVSGGTETEIAGATSASYTVVDADVGATLKVRVGFTDDDGTGETVESAETSAVEPPSPVLTVAAGTTPVTEGTAATFTVTRTVVTAGALTAHYQVSETGDAVTVSEEGAKSVDFADGETGKTVTVPTAGDGGHEADSVVTVTLAADAAYDLGPEAQRSAEVTVEDDDNAAPTGTVTIDDTTPVVGQTLRADTSGIGDPDGLTSRSFTWQWLRVSGGTATAIAGASTASYTVAAADVGATLKVRVGFTDDDGTGETVESAQTSVVAAYTITAASPTVTEGDGGVTLLQFTLTRSETEQRVELGWRVATESTAQTRTDFAGPAQQGTLVFPPRINSRNVYFQVIPDIVDESDETVVLELFSVAGTSEGVTFPATVTGTIVDDDTATLSIAPTSVDEGDSGTRELVFTVSLSLQSDREVTVEYDVGGTAESGTDYEGPTPVLVRFPALSWEPQRIVFGVLGDTDAERHETVEVELRDPGGGAELGTAKAEGTIRNDDGLVLSVAPPEVDEGDAREDRARLTFRVALSGQSDTDVTVDYRVDTGAGTATVGTDFRNKSGTATIRSGRTAAVVNVQVVEDTEFELDETVVMVFESPEGAVFEPGSGRVTGTIRNDDLPRVTVAADAATVTEGEAAVFRLRRPDVDTSEALVVSFTVADPGGVLAGAAPVTATIGAGETEETVSLDTVDDGVHEAHGSVRLTLAAGAGYGLGSEAERSAEVTVLDDDDSPATGSVTVTTATTFTEGETLAADTSGLADADGLDNAGYVYQWVRTSAGGSDTDISGATGATYVLVFADAGATLKVRVTVTDDEGHEATITSAPTSAVAALPRPSVTVVSDGDVTEGSPAVFTLTRTGDLAQTLDVAYEVAATGDFGVTTGAGTATFLADSATVQVSVATTGDGAHEAHGSVTVTLTADTGAAPAYLLGDPSTATVEDDDDSPATGSVTVTGTATEGETLTADTSGLTDGDGLDNAAWAYQWARTPAGGSDADISGATGATYVPVFADVGAILKVKVTVTDDEGHQATFTSAPTSAVAALPRPSVTTASDGDVTEGSPTLFTLTRTGDLAQMLDVAYTVTATGDFGVTTGASTATFLANSATVQVSVATTGDDTHEAHGSVTLMLTADTGADPAYLLGAPSTATAAVRDDDDSPTTGSVTVTVTAAEGETLSADTSGLADGDGLNNAAWAYQWVRTPSGGSDADISGATSQTYVPVFADAGATLKVKVTVTDDEGHQATLTSAPTAAVAGLPRPSVTVASDGDVTEGDTVTFTLTRTGDLAQTLGVAYEVAATGDFGVTTSASTATFPANSSTVQVSVATTGDSTHEAHGSVTLTLTADTGADPAYVLGAPSTATAAVEDDDDSPATGSVTVTTATTFTEGETLTADTSGIADADGLANAGYAYQWVRTPSGGSDADIAGATSQTYVLMFADAGATLKVKVTVTDDEGHQATLTSAPTAAVAGLPRPEVTVASDGDATEGSPAVFTLTRTGDLAGTLDVAYTVTATGDFGVTPFSGMATFLASSATVRVSVATTDDGAHEAHGSVTLTLTADTGADPAYLLGAPSMATAAVEDDDDSPATGSVTVTTATTFTEGETLTADTSGLADADGLNNAAWAYQWVRTPSGGSDADISGATSQTYVPVFADAGATLKVKVTVTDDEGHQATLTSAPTAAVAGLPRPSVTVASDGDATEGSPAVFTLTRTGDLAGTLDVAYEVTATGDFGVTTGASTATFLANDATVQVSVATTGDSTHEAHGSVTVTLTADTGADPAYLLGDPATATAAIRDDDDSPATGAVTVTGTATEGQTLTADTSGLTDADGLDNAAWAYQWVRTPSGGSDADISGATSQTYVPVFADAGATLKVKVTVTDDEGHQATLTSAPTAAVAGLPRPSVTVASDGDVTEGDTVTFTLTRTGDTAQTLDVAYEVAATGDFGAATGVRTATFPADSATVQVSVTTTGDDTHEAHGSVTVTLTADTGANPAYLLGAPSMATVAVRDDDNVAPTGAPTIDDMTPVVGETLTADASGIGDADGLTGATFT